MHYQPPQTVVLVGGSASTHAVAAKLLTSPHIGKLYCLPGNPGIAKIAECMPTDISKTGALARRIAGLHPDLVVVCPEGPLVNGLTNRLAKRGIATFGPTKAAARIEGSKIFAKRLMRRAGVPTAEFFCTGSLMTVIEKLRDDPGPWVVKADGLRQGKGVTVCKTRAEAERTAADLLLNGRDNTILVEKRLSGREVSVMAVCDGVSALLLPLARDHKRRFNGDRGPNTGGMGAFSPVHDVDEAMLARIRVEIIEPTLRQMAKESRPFRGLLYLGAMLTENGPMALEFNCRFGDPETQVQLAHLQGDFYELLWLAARGTFPRILGQLPLPVDQGASVCVFLSAKQYPRGESHDVRIYGVEEAEKVPGVEVFHAATKLDDKGRLVTAGGRVLCVTARAGTVPMARRLANKAVRHIRCRALTCRTDIAAGV